MSKLAVMSEPNRYNTSLEHNSSSTRGNDRQPPCCFAPAVQMQIHNLYFFGLSQLQCADREPQQTRRQLQMVENELQQERNSSELVRQQFSELEECHLRLQKDGEDIRRTAQEAKKFATQVAKQAETLVNYLRAKLADGEVTEIQNGQSVSGLILESVKNRLLVEVMSGDYTEDDCITKLGYFMEQNVDFQQRNLDLLVQIKALAAQVQEKDNEIVSLRMTLDLTTEDVQRKKPRRGRARNPSVE